MSRLLQCGAPLALALCTLSCLSLPKDPVGSYAFAVYDLAEGDIPLPSDLVIEEDHLALPTDDEDLSPTEVAMREWLNTLEAWPTTTPGAVTFSERVDPRTVDSDSLQVWRWGISPERVDDVTLELDDERTKIVMTPPEEGWARGGEYVAMLRGGRDGVRASTGGAFGPDTSFYYVRLDEPLDDYVNNRAFPGDTREERLETAADLEEVRLELAPYFDFFEAVMEPAEARVPRDEVVALWSFSVTTRIELEMDKDSKRMPLPFDLLLDPDTGLVDLSPDAEDDELEFHAKLQASELNGWGTSADLMFDLTGAVEPSTADTATVELWEVGLEARLIPSRVVLMGDEGAEACEADPVPEDCRHVFLKLDPDAIPLAPGTLHAVVVRGGLLDPEGRPVIPMSIGHFMQTPHPIAVGGVSQIGSLDDESAVRLENARVKLDAFLDEIGRDDLITAWPLTTLDAEPEVTNAARLAEDMAWEAPPTIQAIKPAYDLIQEDALSDLFPGVMNPAPAIYWPRTAGVEQVVQGVIPVPYHLDRQSRRWIDDGSYEVEYVPFWAMIPEDTPGPLRVVIFGHAVVTDQRFLITVAGELAKEGFASIAMAFPYHGSRTVCVDSTLLCLPNFLPEELGDLVGLDDDLLWFPPCPAGDAATCGDNNECLDADGYPDDFATTPIIDMNIASGAAFLDIHDIPYIKDHFLQALVELGVLRYSLQTEDWEGVFGDTIQTDRFYYFGQSLGSIIGTDFVATTPSIERAVLNVPGSNLVDMFVDSDYFGPQVEDYLLSEEIADDSYDEHRLLAIASLLIDSVDPHSIGHIYGRDDRTALIQMCRVNEDEGDLIIPNYTTDSLAQVSGLPVIEYPSSLHADLIIPLLGDQMLEDAVDFLAGDLQP